MNKIVLNMIVKDEAENLKACIESVLPIIDGVFITDTGSNGTEYLFDVVSWLGENNIPCKVAEDSWVNFSFNRNKSIQNYKDSTLYTDQDFILFMDADDRGVFPTNDGASVRAMITCGSHYSSAVFRYPDDALSFPRIISVSASSNAQYEGVVHETLVVKDSDYGSTIPDSLFYIVQGHAGSRSKSLTSYLDDAELLLGELQTLKDEVKRSRTHFYIGQSYRCYASRIKLLKPNDPIFDSYPQDYQNNPRFRSYEKSLIEALYHFEACGDNSSYIEQRYVALLNAARIRAQINSSDTTIIINLLHKAIAVNPYRKEAYYELAYFYYRMGLVVLAIKTAECCSMLMEEIYPGWLFVEKWIYKYGYEMLLINMNYQIGNYMKVIELSESLLSKPLISESEISSYKEIASMITDSINKVRANTHNE